MIRLVASMAALIISLLAVACGSDQIAISVSAKVENAITDAVPPEDYSFFVSADSAPNDLADLAERDLYICGILGKIEMVKLMTARESQNTLLFRSAKQRYMDPRQDSAETHESEVLTVVFPTGGKAEFPVEKVVLGGNVAGDSLLASCVENMEESDVFLLDKNLGAIKAERLVSLVFR